VNYRSGAFAVAAVRSLVREWAAAGYDSRALEIVVVENASPDDPSRWIAELEEIGARVVVSASNLGYAGGIELALSRSSGEEDDFLAVLNPDVWFLPGSVKTLVEYLATHPSCGAVAPRAWLDEERVFLLPSIPLPTALGELASELGPISPFLARARAARRTAACLAWWKTETPIEVPMLSGACLFLTRAVARELGTLLDPRYPLYYEDADLARRVRARGLDLVQHPGAGILHHWSRSAGAGAEFEGEPRRRFEISRRAYLERWCSPFARSAIRGAARLVARIPESKRGRPIHELAHLGPSRHSPELELDSKLPMLVELSTSPGFELAAGTFVSGQTRWRFPVGPWAWLFEGRYYLRAYELGSMRFAGAWTFEKTTPARTWPLGAADPLLVEAPSLA
jgi:GT2 family glycosyltransferase